MADEELMALRAQQAVDHAARAAFFMTEALRLRAAEGGDPHPLAQMAAREQPAPIARGQEVVPWLLGWLAANEAPVEVVEAVRARDALGRVRYGQGLRTHDGRDPVADLAQELADALVYLARLKMLGADVEPLRPLLQAILTLWTRA